MKYTKNNMIIVSNLKKIIPNGLFKTFLSYYYRAFIYNSFLSIKRILFLFTNENNYSSFRLEKNGAKEIISRGYKIYNNYLDVDNLELIKNKFDYLIDLKHNVKANNGFSYSNQNDLRNKSSDIILTQPLLDIPQISKLITDNFFLEIACDFFKTEPFIAGLNVRKTFVNNLDSDGVQLYHCDRNHHKLLKIFIYLNEVDSEGGPTVYVERSHKMKPFFWYKKYRYQDSEINKIYKGFNIIELVSRIGSFQVADTTGFHKGKKPTKNDRYMITILYNILKEKTQPIFDIQKDTFASISKRGQLSLQNIARVIN